MCHDRAATKSNFHHQSAPLSRNKWGKKWLFPRGSVCFLCVMIGGLDADIYHCLKQERKAVEDKDVFWY